MLVARAGWLLARGEASPEQILLLAFGRKAAEEMDERIRERLHTEDITARTFHSLALHIIQQGSKKYRQSATWKMILLPVMNSLLLSGASNAARRKRRRRAGGNG